MEQTKEQIDRETEGFLLELMPFGSKDLYEAIKTALSLDISGKEFAEIVSQYCEDCGIGLLDKDNVLDVNAVLYDFILQEARNKISELTEFDFCNDIEKGYIDVYGNYCCTSFDYTEEAKEELLKVISKQTEEVQKELKENKFVSFLLEGLE
jgi:hypothetical protein